MSTLTEKEHVIMDNQIAEAKSKFISKVEVLELLHKKLKEVDALNPFIVDRIDGAAVKDLITSVERLTFSATKDIYI